MEIDLRQAIMNRVQDKSDVELTDIIEGSIHQDERALPGLGVLFEMIWDHSSAAERAQLTQTLHQSIQHSEQSPTSQ